MLLSSASSHNLCHFSQKKARCQCPWILTSRPPITFENECLMPVDWQAFWVFPALDEAMWGWGWEEGVVPALKECIISLRWDGEHHPQILQITTTTRANIWMLPRDHPFLSTLLAHVIFPTHQRAKYYYYHHHSHFTDEKVKAKLMKVICPRP